MKYIAFRFVIEPGASTAPERMFSAAGCIVSKHVNRMKVFK